MAHLISGLIFLPFAVLAYLLIRGVCIRSERGR